MTVINSIQSLTLIALLSCSFLACSVTPELTEVRATDDLDSYVKTYAPSEDAFVAVQRIAKPFIDRRDYDGAIAVFEKYKDKFPTMRVRMEKIIQVLRAPSSNLHVTNLGPGINSQFDEIKPTITADGTRMYFASKDRPNGFGGLDLYISKKEGETWGVAQNLGQSINSRDHESINNISTDGTKIVLYGAFEGHMGRGDNFYFEKTSQGWSRIRVFPPPVNSADWDSDGFFTADGRAFLFTSDRTGVLGDRHPKGDPELQMYPFHGSYGGNTDIFVCFRIGSGWSEPLNLGSIINTPYCERSAYLHPDGKTLYFSSDGHYGLGKLDVFKSVRLRDDSWTEWSEPVNLGKDINTAEDDWGYKVSIDGELSYFSASGKQGGYGQSDLYSISLPKEVQPSEKVITITGKVLDENGNPVTGINGLTWDDLKKRGWKLLDENGNPVDGSGQIDWAEARKRGWRLVDQSGNPIAMDGIIKWEDLATKKSLGELQIDPQTGEFSISVPLGKKYGLFADIPGFYPDSKVIDLTNVKDPRNIKINFDLRSLESMRTKRDKWGDLLAARVNNIFFDFDKYDLKPESFSELDRLVTFIESNPGLRIEIAAHTDSKGTDDYNLKLSEKRAQSVVSYLIEHHIPQNRLASKGYGESRPIADNNTDDGMAMNRRVEFRIAE